MRETCQRILKSSYGKLPLGTAVVTSCQGISDLMKFYDIIIHTTPPFYNHDSDRTDIELLKQCYISTFHRIDELYRHGRCMDIDSSSVSLWDTIRQYMNKTPNDKENGANKSHFYDISNSN